MGDLQSECVTKQILDKVVPVQNQANGRKFLKI